MNAFFCQVPCIVRLTEGLPFLLGCLLRQIVGQVVIEVEAVFGFDAGLVVE